MTKFIAFLTPVVFVLLLAGWASAKDPVPTGRCYREVDFSTTADGSMMVKSAWHCEKTETKTAKKESK